MKRIFLLGFVWMCLVVFVNASNMTERYLKIDNPFHSRQGRLISFNSDKGELTVELEFNVPFLSLPVKESLQMAKGAVANLNLGAVLLSGAIILSFTVIIPALLSLVTKKMYVPNKFGTGTSYRSDKVDDSNVWRYLTILDNLLLENNIDTTSCIQRIACWSVKNSAKKVSVGQGSSTDKILDGLASSEWLMHYLQETPLNAAVENGYNGTNCSKEYWKCQLNQQTIQLLMNKFVNFINVIR